MMLTEVSLALCRSEVVNGIVGDSGIVDVRRIIGGSRVVEGGRVVDVGRRISVVSIRSGSGYIRF